MRTFVMSDIHGHFKEFMKLLQYVNFNSKDRLIILGDILDRGPNSFELFCYIRDRKNITLLMGNHELMFLDYQREVSINLGNTVCTNRWILNGAKNTIDSFVRSIGKLDYNPLVDLESYLLKCKYYTLVDDYILLHSGYGFSGIDMSDSEIIHQLSKVDEFNLVWDRDFWRESFIDNDCIIPSNRTVICGHTGIHKQVPVKKLKKANIPNLLYRKFDNNSSVIDLDLSTIQTGMLAIFELKSRELIYIDMKGKIASAILD